MMKCPKCAHPKTFVASTPKTHNMQGTGVMRRRKCPECGANFITLETVFEPEKKPKKVKPRLFTPRETLTEE